LNKPEKKGGEGVLEVMFQGHGGHGSVVAAKLLAQAAARAGFQAQSFASYGALRRGGRVDGYVRISEERPLLRCKMYRADYLVVMDESLFDAQETPRAVKEDGRILINSAQSDTHFQSHGRPKVFTLDAYRIAREKDLSIPGGMPVINTTLLGGLAGIMEGLPLEHVVEAIREGTPNPKKNAECAVEGYRRMTASPGAEKAGQDSVASAGTASAGRVPRYIVEKMGPCHRCQICYVVCPNLAIHCEGDPLRFYVKEDACAGCGICIHECPRHAIAWKE
jgi:pyruvate ferredoxin oxidoreductase gamma subunit